MRALLGILNLFGLDLLRTARALYCLPKFLRDYNAFRKMQAAGDHGFPMTRILPILTDHLENAGVASGAYFHQDLYVASRICKARPQRHVDVGSLVAGFVAHVASFRPIEVIDIRPLRTGAANISFLCADLQDPGSTRLVGVSDSVSSLHALEHFGLGRYGDPLAVDGFEIGLRNVASLVAPGGILYVGLPLGPQRVEFNAHRVIAAATVPAILADSFVLERFSYIDDAGEFHEDAGFATADVNINFKCHHGCGIYELRKAGSPVHVAVV